MKKSLLALAVFSAFAASAHAQSSITIYGSIDAGVRYRTNVNAAGDNQLSMASGTSNSNRIGFKGVEDLGGGMNAHFALEGGFSSKTGAGSTIPGTLFERTASVGIGGNWGSLDFGNQYSGAFWTIFGYDPFSYRYPTIIPLSTAAAGTQVNPLVTSSVGGTRFLNDIQYKGKFGPVTAYVDYALGEQAGSTGNGSGQGVALSYAGGPITVGGAYTRRKPNVGTAAAPAFRDNDQWTIGASYTQAPFRIATGYISEEQDVALGEARTRNAWLGGSFNFTPAFSVTAAYYHTRQSGLAGLDARRKLFIVGGSYSLSKRTNLYANWDNTRYEGRSTFTGTGAAFAQPAGQTKQNGITIGVNHLF